MKFFLKLSKKKLSIPFVICAIGVALGGATFFENKALYKLDHPKPYNVSCIKCHSDPKTLKAIADKANDKLYLVHQGQLTEKQLKDLMAAGPDATSAKPSYSYK